MPSDERDRPPHQEEAADEVERCPACGSTEWIPIVYGLPDPELFAAEGRGDVAIGGCLMFPERPDVECRQCSTQYRSQFRPDDDKYEDGSDDPPTDR